MNEVIKELIIHLEASGIDLDAFSEVNISLSEARDTVITVRPDGFEEARVFTQKESGRFYQMVLRREDALSEIKLQANSNLKNAFG